MRQILSGVYAWSWFSIEKQLDFNGHVLMGGADREWVMIDPPPLQAADRAQIGRLGRVTAIVLTNRDHLREAAGCRETFGAPIYIHAADAPLIDINPDETYGDGDRLPGDLVAVHVPDGKSPGESALWWPRGRALIVGDAVIGAPAGAVRMLPEDKFADPRRAKDGLRALLDERLDYDALLVGDGASIPTGGREALGRLVIASRRTPNEGEEHVQDL